MSASTNLTKLRHLWRKAEQRRLGAYLIVAAQHPDGTIEYWDGMVGSPIDEEAIEQLRARGYAVCVRWIQPEFMDECMADYEDGWRSPPR